MPNATVRANARAMPEGTEAPSEHENSRIQAFGRAYARWLTACAQIELPESHESEQFTKATFTQERLALRELFLVPAGCAETVWSKLAVFEILLVRERIAGPAKDCILLLALGSIKADLMNLGIGGEF